MSTSKAEIALATLAQEVSNFEKALIEFIEVKKMMPEPALTISHMNAKLQRRPIAIIGMASIFPQARTLQEYWENIIRKVDCITDIPSSRWDLNSYYDKNPRAIDKTYCKRGGFIPEVDFDPMEFGIPPKVLEVTDVSQLLSLLVAKEALEDAGYAESRPFDRERTGVILGVALARQLSMPLGARLQYPIWEQVLKSSGLSDQDTQRIIAKIKAAYVEWEENAFPGMLGNIVAGRIANRLDLGGTNCVVDAACASSMGALAMAMSELVEHRADMMLTGGVDTDNSVMAYVCFSKTPAVSPGEKVKPFDADADGMMLGEGIGLMVLKRLEDAERDGDRIYAVIKGVGSSSDGRYKSIYAPRPLGQVRALRRAYEDAGFAPSTVGLIEAHGTGTMAGDPAELESLREVLAAESFQGQRIALGTVKSQIGHTKAAAGAASLIKTALALHHKILPATINVNQPHPKVDHGRSPLYLNTETRPWIRTASAPPRRAGVSSFGFGGTNYHVVLEEYQDEQQQPYRLHRSPQPLLLSAASPQELLVQSQQILQQLHSEAGAVYFQELTQNSCGKRIPEAEARLGFVAESLENACVLLQTGIECLQNQLQAAAWEHPRGIYYRRTGVNPAAKVVALFSGQGSQYLDMGRELVNNFPELRQIYRSVDALFEQAGLEPLSRVVFPPPQFAPDARQAQAERLKRTEYAQAAIAAMSVGLYKLLQQAGFEPDFVAGHSFGELTALWAAGVLTQADYFSLVKARGLAMAAASDRQPDAGLMLAVKGEVSRVAALIPDFPGVAIANHNSPRQVVLAGSRAAMTQVQKMLQAEGYGTVALPVAGAFHTAAVGHAQKPLAQAIAATRFHAPQRPVYSNVTGAAYPTEPNAIQQLLMGHLTQPVQFQQEIENLYAQGGYFFIEFGPKGVLAHLVREILGDRPHLALSCNSSQQKDSDLQLRTAMVQLRVAGLALDQSDPYQLEPAPLIERKNRPLCIQLTGANYVSDKTRQAFIQALQDGHRVTLKALDLRKVAFPARSEPQNGSIAPAAAAASTPAQDPLLYASGANLHTPAPVPSATAIAFAPPTPAVGAPPAQPCGPSQTAQPPRSPTTLTTAAPATTANPAPSHRPKPPEPPMDDQRLLASLDQGLAAFNHHHDGILKLHEQALQQQGEYTQICLQLMQQQQGLFATASGKGQAVHPEIQQAILQSSERSLQQFHHHQGETLRLHEQCLNYQLEQTKLFFQLIQQQYQQLLNQPTAEAPLPPETNFAVSPPQPQSSPTDSLVRPHPTPATVAGNGIGSLNGWNGSAADGQEPHPSPVESPHRGHPVGLPQPQPQDLARAGAETRSPASAAWDGDITRLSQTLMVVVAEKTGYPPDLLELEMDLEADLGIDSIKRVEILGALQENYPGLPEPDLEKLAALRTLAEVVDFMATGMPPVNSETGNGTGQSISAATPAVDLGTVPAAAIPPAPLNSDQAQLSQVLLEIVSQKTGYPADLLELEMDMEADLGIDSIKRVEILGALQEAYPGLPEPDLENLTALRTLEQVLELI